jgi:hypothetical protein
MHQRREPGGQIGIQPHRLLEHPQDMVAGIDFGVMGGGLRDAEQAVHLGHQHRQRPALAQHAEVGRRCRCHQRPGGLLPDPLGDQRLDLAIGDHFAAQRERFRGHAKAEGLEARGESRQPQDAHRILAKGIGDMPQQPGVQVVAALKRIDQRAVRGLRHGINGQIAAAQIGFQTDRGVGMHRESVIAGSGLALGPRQGVFLVGVRVEEHGKRPPHRLEPPSGQGLGAGADHHPVMLVHRQAE